MVSQWKDLQNVPDLSRSQLSSLINGVDGADYIKDWNNDIQSIKELPTTTVQERIIREKLIQKSLFEFNKTATETAINIIKGNIPPLNPDESSDKFIYLEMGFLFKWYFNSWWIWKYWWWRSFKICCI